MWVCLLLCYVRFCFCCCFFFLVDCVWFILSGLGDSKKWAAFSHLFVNLISTTVRHPIDDKHTEHWGCGNPKQRVLCKQKHPMPPYPPPINQPPNSLFFCNISWGASAPQTPPRPLACVAFLWPLADDSESGGVGTGKNLCSIQSSFCQSDKHKSQTPSRLQAHWTLGVWQS